MLPVETDGSGTRFTERRLMTSQESVPPPGPAAQADVERLARFEQSVRRYWRLAEQTAQTNGLALRDYDLLLVLSAAEQPWVTVSELAARLLRPATSMYEVVDGVEVLGLVKRRSHPDNRRIIQVGLTEDGKIMLAKLVCVDRQHLKQFGPALGASVTSVTDC